MACPEQSAKDGQAGGAVPGPVLPVLIVAAAAAWRCSRFQGRPGRVPWRSYTLVSSSRCEICEPTASLILCSNERTWSFAMLQSSPRRFAISSAWIALRSRSSQRPDRSLSAFLRKSLIFISTKTTRSGSFDLAKTRNASMHSLSGVSISLLSLQRRALACCSEVKISSWLAAICRHQGFLR